MTENTKDYIKNGNGAVDGISANNFDVDAAYKPEPMIPTGSYSACVTSVKFDAENFCIVWGLVLKCNKSYASDGETPVDGIQLFFRNWLPRSGDENEYSTNGRTTKRQSKISIIKKFADGMKIDISTPMKIAEAIQYQTWVGMDVKVDVQVAESKGEVRNEVSSMVGA